MPCNAATTPVTTHLFLDDSATAVFVVADAGFFNTWPSSNTTRHCSHGHMRVQQVTSMKELVG